jgi:hypothetical protein
LCLHTCWLAPQPCQHQGSVPWARPATTPHLLVREYLFNAGLEVVALAAHDAAHGLHNGALLDGARRHRGQQRRVAAGRGTHTGALGVRGEQINMHVVAPAGEETLHIGNAHSQEVVARADERHVVPLQCTDRARGQRLSSAAWQ